MKKIPRFIPSLSFLDILHALFSRQYSYSEKNELQVFSEKFAEYLGVEFAIPVPSARMGLAALLNAIGLPKGGEIIMPSLTFYAIPMIFRKFGFKVRFVDIDSSTYCINAAQIEKAITSSTVAIVPVHLYGRACNMDIIMDIAKKNKLTVIEDCAQSCGGMYKGKYLGSFGDGAIFSLHHHKNFSVLGCGMLIVKSKEVADRAWLWLKDNIITETKHLIKDIFYASMISLVTEQRCWKIVHYLLFACNMLGFDLIEALTNEVVDRKKDITAAKCCMPIYLHGRIGLLMLKKIDMLNKRRIHNGNKLIELLHGSKDIKIPSLAPNGENIYSTFVIKVKNRRIFRKKMFKNGIDIHFGNMFVGPYLPGFEGLGEACAALDAVKRMVHLPVYPSLEDNDIERIAKCVIAAANC